MLDLLIKPFEYSFMQKALLEIIIVSLITGVIGTFLVLKNLAFLSEALSHAVFPGIVVSFILHINLIIGALVAGILSVAGISVISSKKLKENTSVGIFFSSAFALGVILISTLKNYTGDLASFLIGNILGVSIQDILITFVLSLLIIFLVVKFYNEFLITTFDPLFAQSLGINTTFFNILFNILIAITVVISIQAVGNVLVVALLIIPPATARLVFNNIPEIIVTSVILTLFSGILGLYASYYYNVACGACIVLISSLVFFITYFLTKVNLK